MSTISSVLSSVSEVFGLQQMKMMLPNVEPRFMVNPWSSVRWTEAVPPPAGFAENANVFRDLPARYYDDVFASTVDSAENLRKICLEHMSQLKS